MDISALPAIVNKAGGGGNNNIVISTANCGKITFHWYFAPEDVYEPCYWKNSTAKAGKGSSMKDPHGGSDTPVKATKL